MKLDHQTMLEAFDEAGGRGDVLSIRRADVARLRNLPFELFAPIFYQLFKWFLDGDETPLADPLANAMLDGMKEEQKRNALRRRAFLVAQKNRIDQRWHKEKDVRTSGIPRNTTEYQPKPKPKPEPKPEPITGLGSGGDGASRVDTAPPTPFTEADAKKFLAMNAPQISSLPEMQLNGKPTMRCTQLLTADVDDAVELIGNEIFGDDRDEETYTTFDEPIAEMARRMEAIGKEAVFRKVLVKAMVDSEADEVDNPAAFVMSRCKRCMEAVNALKSRG